MFGQAHAGLGWMIGALVPGSDRRLRGWCFGASLAPDIDSVLRPLSSHWHDLWHHTFGHNVFFGVLVTAAAWLHHLHRPLSRRVYASALTAACFAIHILTDMKLSGWEVYIFWPVNRVGVEFHPNYSLMQPVNMWLVYFFLIAPFFVWIVRPVTPLDLLSARLDRIVLNFFRRKTAACATCSQPCNNACDACGKPACMKHGAVGWRFRIRCPACRDCGVPGG